MVGRRGWKMDARRSKVAVLTALLWCASIVLGGQPARATLPPGNSVQQWNRIAEDTVVTSGVFQSEGMIYMAYVSAAVYDAAVAVEGGYRSYGPPIAAPPGASVDAAVIQAAYRTLVHYFSARADVLNGLRSEALAAIDDGASKDAGILVGNAAADQVITLRGSDGRSEPFGSTSEFPTKPEGPGVWRLTPPAFAKPQTPWVGEVEPFVARDKDQFLPAPPPDLSGAEWAEAFTQIKLYGAATGSQRTDAQTAVARFWTANVIRQYNVALRDVASSTEMDVLQTARLEAMVNVIGADSLISCLRAKYHYLFWRPVTAIDPTSVKSTGDGFGPAPGYDDGNPITAEQTGWRPFLTTPNHPEYPAAHGCITSAVAEVFTEVLGTKKIDLTLHGTDLSGPLHAERTYATAQDLRAEIIDARLWAGLHYRFSSEAGVVLGRQVAMYDLRNLFGVDTDTGPAA